MNALLNVRFPPIRGAFLFRTRVCTLFTLAAFVLLVVEGMAEDRAQKARSLKAIPTTPLPRRAIDYTFEVTKIEPSPQDGIYTGHFRFINLRPKAVDIVGFDEPDRRSRFIPRFVGFDTLVNGKWETKSIGFCGTGAQGFAMKSQVPYEFICHLWALSEQETPLTARVTVDGIFVSDPFLLNWREDRRKGTFDAAKKRNFQEVREAFLKAGFKPELIEGDDFCERILRSVMKPAESAKEDSFVGFKGKLDVSPEIKLDGSIRIDFTSDETKDREPQYRGWWVINPNKFNPTWFKTTARENVRASPLGPGVSMELDDGSGLSGPDVHLYLSINYVPPAEIGSVPIAEKAETLFRKMLDNLEPWLKDR